MLRPVAVTLLLAVLSASTPQNYSSRDDAYYAERAVGAYVYVLVTHSGIMGNGSGSCIDDYHVLTAAHLMHTDDSVLSVGHLPDDLVMATVVARDTSVDLMLLRSRRKCDKYLKVGQRPPRSGQRTVSVGAPLGTDGMIVFGRVAAVNEEKGRFLVDQTTIHGQSGSAVIFLGGRDAGRLGGVVSMGWGEKGAGVVTVAHDATVIRAFLERAGLSL